MGTAYRLCRHRLRLRLDRADLEKAMTEPILNHIYTGDCLEIMKDWPDKCVDLVVTSPPYNMRTRIRNGEYTTRERSEHFSKKYKYFDDDLPMEEYYRVHHTALSEMLRLAPVVCWNVGIVTGSKEAVLRLMGDYHKQIRDIIVWDKGCGQPAMHGAVINRAMELIIMLESNGAAGRAFSAPSFSRGEMEDIWRIPPTPNLDGHSASFPIELPSRAINGWSRPGGVVLDCFAGTGTTLVAAKQLGRKYIGIEIEPRYVAICKERLKQEELF